MADEPETPVTGKNDEPATPPAASKDGAETPAPIQRDAPSGVTAAKAVTEAHAPVKQEPQRLATPATAEAEAPVTAVKVETGAPAGATEAEAEASATAAEDEHERNVRVRRGLLLLSVANWAIAILAWTISAYLGITSPASIFVYTVLFVIGLFAATVAIAAYLLEKFAHRPQPTTSEAVEGDESDAAAIPSA